MFRSAGSFLQATTADKFSTHVPRLFFPRDNVEHLAFPGHKEIEGRKGYQVLMVALDQGVHRVHRVQQDLAEMLVFKEKMVIPVHRVIEGSQESPAFLVPPEEPVQLVHLDPQGLQDSR